MNLRLMGSLFAGGLAMFVGCGNSGVVCEAACQIPVQIAFTAPRVAFGDVLRVCLAGQGCTNFPVTSAAHGRQTAGGGRPAVDGIPIIRGRGSIALNVPPRAYRVTATLFRRHGSAQASRGRAATRLRVHRSDAPCSCPSATGMLRFDG